MRGPQRRKKGKSKDSTPKSPPTGPQEPPISKLTLRLPPLSSAATVRAVPIPPAVYHPRTPELAPEAGLLPLDDDLDMYMPEVPYVPSPRQQLINQFWEDRVTDVHNQKEDLDSEILSNEVTSHPQNVKDPVLQGAGEKRKASTQNLERTSSTNHPDGDSSDSDLSIQLSVSKKARKSPKEPVEVEETEGELDKLAKRKQGRKLNKKEHGVDSVEEEEDSYKNTFVLFIPSAAGSARRVELKSVTPYDEALEVIYDNIGCLDVTKKPELSYKLSTATAKAVSISLNSERDWKGLQKEVISQQKTKKRSIPVNILVPDRYLKSLEVAMGSKKPGRGQAGSSRSIKSKKMVLMDLNGDSDDDNHDDGTMEREKQALEQLERALTKCQLCGPGKFCKISKTGDHVNLTWNQRRAWSIALANKQHGVTVSTPPKADIFHTFFTSLSGPVASTTTPAPAPAPETPAPGMAPGIMAPFNFMMSPWTMPPFGYPHVPNNSLYPMPKTPSSHQSHRLPSSDPPDEDLENPYPSIIDFLQQLDKKHAHRGLSRHLNIFEEKDFYNINEVAKISAERLSSKEFGFTAGNAQFFLDAISKEMKHIDRAIRSGRSRRQ